jgi:hypothetical protein
MSAKLTRERAEEFGATWNSGDADLVASFFAEDVSIMPRWDPMHSARVILAKSKSVVVSRLFSTAFPEANSKI